MTLPYVATFVCLGLWASSLLGLLVIAVVNPYKPFGHKWDMSDPRHILLLMSMTSWTSMWCFRTMY